MYVPGKSSGSSSLMESSSRRGDFTSSASVTTTKADAFKAGSIILMHRKYKSVKMNVRAVMYLGLQNAKILSNCRAYSCPYRRQYYCCYSFQSLWPI